MEPVWNNKRTLMGSAAGVFILLLGGWGWTRSASDGRGDAGGFKSEASPAAIEFAAQGTNPAPSTESASDNAPAPAESPTPSVLVVHVVGAVKRPGVYSFKPGDRIYNAIRAAGGFKANARQDALNIANALQDADQIYVPTRAEAATPKQVSVASTARAPRVSSPSSYTGKSYSIPAPSYGVAPIVLPRPVLVSGSPVVRSSQVSPEESEPRPVGRVIGKPEPAVAAASLSSDTATTPAEIVGSGSAPAPLTASPRSAPKGSGTSAKFKNPGDGVVNLNTANAGELTKLPGVGPSTAAKILEYRQQIGKFADASQIQDVKGIGPKKYEKMKPFLTVK